MRIEQIVELQLRGPGPPGRTCTSITSYFHDKTKISEENLRVGFRLLLKCYTRQRTYFLLPRGSRRGALAPPGNYDVKYFLCLNLQSKPKYTYLN